MQLRGWLQKAIYLLDLETPNGHELWRYLLESVYFECYCKPIYMIMKKKDIFRNGSKNETAVQ